MPGVGGEFEQVRSLQFNVDDLEFTREFHADVNRRLREIETGERALRIAQPHRDDVAPLAATEFQHPAALDRRWRQTQQNTDCRQPIGMRLRQRMTRISDDIVGSGGHARLAEKRGRWGYGRGFVFEFSSLDEDYCEHNPRNEGKS